MTLQSRLRVLFPAAPKGSWVLRDDGEGPYIAEWHLDSPQPGEQELAAITEEQVRAYELSHHGLLKKREVVRLADASAASFMAAYPDSEKQSWPQKQVEAERIASGATDPSLFPIIAAESEMSGQPPSSIAARVLARALIFSKAAGIISGFRQRASAAIDEATSIEGIDAAVEAERELLIQKLAELA